MAQADVSQARYGDESERSPIAIVGIGCRFPGGANGPESFWKLLCDGVDAITEIPADRWDLRAFYDPDPETRGTTNIRFGGFIQGIDQFDPDFFGISPREAPCIDPQQRLLLEMAWEAIEDGGEVLDAVRGSNTGVFVGCSTNDYLTLQGSLRDPALLDLHTTMGSALSIAANRISYCLNLQGPSVALDTACSSSLTAIHLACRSLMRAECATALAGGVNAIITPRNFISIKTASMLSVDGRCKAFDSRANGFVRAEGAGMVLLKPLKAAVADGNPIYAVIRGTACNQDGRTSGITVPSQQAQEALVAQACTAAGVLPSEVYYVEAHGTGTPVGDPIEAHALSAALCQERPDGSPCVVGSVKTNIGHTEAAAGVAGVIKVALILRHRAIPPNLHLIKPNPRIDFEKLKLRVPQVLEPVPAGRVVAGINSFGFGGANAHAVLESPPIESENLELRPKTAETCLLPLSARSDEVLPEIARRYADFFRKNRLNRPEWLHDVCSTASLHRTHHEHRLVVVAGSADEFASKLEAFANGEARPGLSSSRVEAARKLVFLFSGQGPQWWAMGRQLHAQEPVFRHKLEECDRLLRQWSQWSVLEELMANEARSRLKETAIAQPAIFSLQVALAALWSSWGVEPDGVVGHSVGEVAAAHVAGALSLADAARVIFHRGRCMELAPITGGMLAATLAEGEARSLVEQYGADCVSLAAINSPSSVTFSGDRELLSLLESDLTARNVFCRFLRVQYAFHSAQMDPIELELVHCLSDLVSRPPRIDMFSTVTGSPARGECFDSAYWWRNVRNTVRFAEAIDGFVSRGATAFLEISPHPVLASAVLECTPRGSFHPIALPSLRRGEDERATMLGSLGALHTKGYPVNWRALFPPGGRCLHLPAYPWKHRRYWQESEESRQERLETFVHPLLGRRIRSANPYWENKLEGRLRTFFADHRVQGMIVFPAAGYVEMALAGGRQISGAEGCRLEEIEIHKPLFLPEDGEAPNLQVIYNPTEKAFQILSRAKDSQDFWTLHCSGKLAPAPTGDPVLEDPARFLEQCRQELSVAEIYRLFADSGLQYGPRFQGIKHLWRGEGQALGKIAPPAQFDDEKYQVPPALLDSCFQVLLSAAGPAEENSTLALYLPARITRVRLHRKPGPEVWCHGRVTKRHRGMIETNLLIINPDGAVAIEIEGFVCLAVEGARRSARQSLEGALYEFQWQLQPLSSNGAQGPPASLADLPVLARRLQETANRSALSSEDAKLLKLETEIDRLCACYIAKALDQLGFPLQEGAHISAESLHSRVAPQHHALLGRYMKMLEEDGVLVKTESGWTASLTHEQEDPEQLWRANVARLPGYLPEACLLRLCGRQLAEVLRGQTDQVEILFGGNSLVDRFFNDSLGFRPCYQTIQDVVQMVVEKLPEGRKLRILELGAGTGGLTSRVVEALVLPPEQVEYVFTDLTSHFLAKAERKFHSCPFMRYQTLDLEKSPLEQGFGEHTFDLILAANVLHATSDVRRSLAHIKELLASAGMLVVLEIDHPSRFIDIVFAPTKGWWSFSDTDLRIDYPLLSGSRWLEVLKDEGFVDAAAVSDVGGLRDTRHVVLLAQAPHAPERAAANPIPLTAAAGSWLLFADESGVATRLANHLTARGGSCMIATVGTAYQEIPGGHFQIRPAEDEDMRRLLETAAARCGHLEGVVFLWSLDQPMDCEPSVTELDRAQDRGCHSVLALVRALAECNQFPQLWLVTRGAQPAGLDRHVTISQTALWGLVRVIMNEHPRLRCRIIDLAIVGCEDETQGLVEELCANASEEEIALRGSARYVLRVIHSQVATRGAVRAATGGPFRVEITKPGVVDDLVLRPLLRREPGPGEIEVEVAAAGLNFRDVMKTLGIYPRESQDNLALGDECAGRVVAVGQGVTDFRLGDRVGVALASHCLSSHVTCGVGQVAHIPASLDWEAAVTVPVAFMTAAYALRHLARIAAGERVLIHSAAGGVGMAAMQIALGAGCEVFATAGNAEKRDFLRALGVRHVMDSHGLLFADEVMRITGGQGVDVVLNSLAGEAMTQSLSLLRHNGRFIEIGKRDIFGNSKIGLRPFRTNIALFSLDLIVAAQQQPGVLRDLWNRILTEIQQGKIYTLPTRLFPMKNAAMAFRCMMGGEHIGKIVLTVTGNERTVERFPDPGALRFDRNATYLITGGLGGFGLEVARWMAEHGAGHLVLIGRSGASSDAARQAVKDLRERSVRVTVAKADISSEEDVAEVLGDIRRTMPPLRGLIHAAMVLDDGVVQQLDPQRFRNVTAPKMRGAWNLHQQTRGDPLDFFVLFSSITSVIGNSGQANYAAANAFLDGLAYYRRAQGLPALTVNWGPLTEVGYVARHRGLSESLAYLGMRSLELRPALSMLGRLLQTEHPQVGVIEANWDQWAKTLGSLRVPARFATLITQAGTNSDQIAEGTAAREAILSASEGVRKDLVESFLRAQAARVMRCPAASLDMSKPLQELGLDSLMAVELINRIEGELGLAIPPGKLIGSQNLSEIAAVLVQIAEGSSSVAPQRPSSGLTSGQDFAHVERESGTLDHSSKSGEREVGTL